jgi:hypothetical protein
MEMRKSELVQFFQLRVSPEAGEVNFQKGQTTHQSLAYWLKSVHGRSACASWWRVLIWYKHYEAQNMNPCGQKLQLRVSPEAGEVNFQKGQTTHQSLAYWFLHALDEVDGNEKKRSREVGMRQLMESVNLVQALRSPEHESLEGRPNQRLLTVWMDSATISTASWHAGRISLLDSRSIARA